MKYSFVAIAVFSGLALAQSNLPVCAQPCIADAIASTTNCKITDVACQCESANKAAIQGAATSCVLSACKDKAVEVLQAANAACANLPAQSASSTPSATPTPTPTPAATPTPTPTPKAAETSSASVAGSVTTQAAVPTTTATPSSNATTSAPPLQVTNAAATLYGSIGSVFAIGMAVLAAI